MPPPPHKSSATFKEQIIFKVFVILKECVSDKFGVLNACFQAWVGGVEENVKMTFCFKRKEPKIAKNGKSTLVI